MFLSGYLESHVMRLGLLQMKLTYIKDAKDVNMLNIKSTSGLGASVQSILTIRFGLRLSVFEQY